MPTHYRTGTETIEIAARRHLFAAAPEAYGCHMIALPGTPATLLSVLAMPSPTMNRVIGLPGDTPLSPDTLARIQQTFRARGIAQFWLHAWDTPDSAPLRDSLLALGCRQQGAWAKFELALAPPTSAPAPAPAPESARAPEPESAPEPEPARARAAAPAPSLTVRLAQGADYNVAGQIAHRSFGKWPVLEPWMAALAGHKEWHVFLACDDDGTPLATGALLIEGRHAWLGMGATLPEARRRGAQQALLAARLAAARAAGCITVSVEAEAAEPGHSSPSLNNILRAGFRQLGTRGNYLCDS